jgi:putative ABC transport system permease protein
MRIVRQLLTESVLLALLAAILGSLIAHFGVRALVAWLPAAAVNFADIHVDGRVIGYTIALALLTVLIFGVAPALSVPIGRSFEELRASGRSATPSATRSRALRTLVGAEIALSVVLGIGGALMLQSFAHLRLQSPGFDASHVLTMKVSIPGQKYRAGSSRLRLNQDLLERVRALPGVVSAGEIQILPLGGGNWNPGLNVEGRTYRPNEEPEVDWRVVTLGYFEAMSIPLISGRRFDERDRVDAPGVALVNQTLAARVFGRESPLGKRVWTGFEGKDNWVTIVGVVGDVKDQSLAGPARPQLYRPHGQFPMSPMQLMVRTTGNPMRSAPEVQRIIWSLDRDIAIADVQPLGHVLGDSVAQPRLLTALLTGFAALAILLGAVGLFGVIGYMVDRRQQEFGIRMALGAGPRELVRMVLGEGIRTVAFGSAVGVLAAALLSGVLATQLYELKPLQPDTFIGIALLVVATALLAMISPARRAGKTNQLGMLREG